MKKKILILESDRKVLEILSFVLGREGYQIVKANDGLAGIQLAGEQGPDLILLDLTKTVVDIDSEVNMDSFTACRCLREEGIAAPILICTTLDDESEKAFSLGATDYIKKPFAIKDLLLRVNVNTWHMEMPPTGVGAISKRQVFGRITIYPDQYVIMKDGVVLALSQREYKLICFLAKEPGKVFSREELLREVWEYAGYLGDLRTVDTMIHHLREKIEDDPSNPSIIATKRGRGYFLAV